MILQSIRTRLTLWYTAILSAGLILFSITVWIALRHALYADLTGTLLNQADGFAEYLHIEDHGNRARLAHEIREYSQSLPTSYLLSVSDEQGRSIYRSAGFSAGQDARGERTPFRLRGNDHRYLAVSRAVQLQQGTIRIVLAISSEAMDRSIQLLGLLLCLTVPVFVICAAGGGYWLSRRALAPVDRITERARMIGVSNLSERLPVPRTNDELQRLAQAWNDMLTRLEAAVSRISQFTADASHELRTPVAIIRFAAENALRKMRSESEYRAALERIQGQSEDMTRLIEDLLFLARSGLSTELEALELQPLIIGACADLRPLASAKSITLSEQLPEKSVTVLGNSSALHRMLFILLDNAIKYTPDGGLVRVNLEQNGTHAILRVEDTGVGIPEEARTRVFQRFFRVDPSRTKDSGGHGLGLAIAQTIVHQHKASIELESKASGGCVFSVSLPVLA